MKLQDAFRKLDKVRDEFQAAKFSLAQILRLYDDHPSIHHAGKKEQITLGQLEFCAENLEITYITRLFAEFEDILRDYWLYGRNRTSRPRMIDLINNLASYCIMNADDAQDAHEIRDYRNDIIHDHLKDPRFDFAECCSRLARFVRWLPQQW